MHLGLTAPQAMSAGLPCASAPLFGEDGGEAFSGAPARKGDVSAKTSTGSSASSNALLLTTVRRVMALCGRLSFFGR